MRNTRDRVRHTLLFELIALAIVTPFGGVIFHLQMGDFGTIAVVSTSVAMVWNYGFNLVFDHALQWRFKDVRKTLPVRVIHAVLFEAGLLVLLVPFIAWYLAITWWQAFRIDVSLSGFYLVFAFVFNWVYDIVFPVPPLDETA